MASREIDGEAVLRGADIAVRVAAADNDGPSSSVAGRLVRCCDAALRQRPTAPSMPCCPVVRGRASSSWPALTAPKACSSCRSIRVSFRRQGAVVLRVHVHDALAASCPETNRALCEQTLVLDEVEWTQPSAPATPLP